MRPPSVAFEPRIGRKAHDRLLTPVSHSAAPILGLRGFLDIDEHWHMSFVGDGGGFGVDGVEKTWQAELLAGYRFRLKYTDLGVLIGYKGVGVDVERDTKDIEGDLIYHGPALKLALEF